MLHCTLFHAVLHLVYTSRTAELHHLKTEQLKQTRKDRDASLLPLVEVVSLFPQRVLLGIHPKSHHSSPPGES